MTTNMVLLVIPAFIVGFILGRVWFHKQANGSIILGRSESGNDRIVFQLGMEYDEIVEHKVVIFKVVKEKPHFSSQEKQSL